MKHPKFWARFFLVAAIATAVLIFWFSAQKGNASQAMSDRVTLRVARLLRPDFIHMSRRARRSYLIMLSTFIRKNGHFCEFALLGFNLMGAVRFYRPELSGGDCRLRAMGAAVLYATTDELHQLFVNERSAQVLDVLIDSAGSLAGTLVLTLCLAILLRLHQLFVNERAAQVLDVLIDSAGSLTGTLLMTLCLTILLRLQQLRASRH